MAAKDQPEPQRLLFVFLSTEEPEDATKEQASQFAAGQGGHLHPVMCVDKDINDLTTFKDLVAESEQMEKEWHIVLIAGLAGKNGVPPTSEDADEPLNAMLKTVQGGGDISKYMALDKQENPVQFSQG